MSKDTILIVDDERFFCNLLQNVLEEDYQIIVVSNGLDALDILKRQHVDLILLDIFMPDINGYEICQKIKRINSCSTIPIIFLTVKIESKDETKGFAMGAVDFILKPISPPVAKAKVATQLAMSDKNSKLQQHSLEVERLVSRRTVELTQEIAEKQKVYEKLHYLANYDQLTQLPNRNLFNERLAYVYKLAKRNKTSFSLLLIDLDRFKNVNDSLGHHVGDLLLTQVGQRLSACLRGVDTVARLGGDEFTVTLTELHHKQDAAIVAKKIISELSKPFDIYGQLVQIGSSIGITSFPEDGGELSSMLKNADMAMYEVKNHGKNAYKFFTPDMKLHANYRMELEKDLREAFRTDQLFLNYQPIVNIQDENICGVEALLRWTHPEYGEISPKNIIAIAEESDLIISLGEWILTTACKQIGLWQSQGFSDLYMAINMSSRQFEERFNCTQLIKKLIQQYKLPENSIQLEITENLMFEDSKLLLETFLELKKVGVLLSVDDFGTGYSSLSYLRRFPVDVLKVDQSFIQDLNRGSGDDALIKAIIAMGKSLNLKVIAEGVELIDQLEFLQQHLCIFAQGFYFSKPESANAIENLLKQKKNLFA